MGYIKIFLLVLATVLICEYASAAVSTSACPPKSKVYNNKPECHSDADCQKYGKICCPNQFNTKSCTSRAPYRMNDKGSAGSRSNSASASGNKWGSRQHQRS